MMKISIIIPSFQRKDLIANLLNDIRHQCGPSPEVVIVDDHSKDGSVEFLSSSFPEVKILENPVNSGPAVTRNNAIRHATGDIIVGFDSDVSLPDSKLLLKIHEVFESNSKISCVAFRLFDPDGKTDDVKRWWHPKPLATHSTTAFESDYFSGTAFAIRRTTLDAAGLFPEFIYMHYEECILAYQIIRAGGFITYRPELTVIHHARPEKRRSRIRSYFKPRNQIAFAVTCLPLLPALNYSVPRIVYSFLVSVKELTLGQYVSAMISAISNMPIYLRNRKPISNEDFKHLKQLRSASNTARFVQS